MDSQHHHLGGVVHRLLIAALVMATYVLSFAVATPRAEAFSSPGVPIEYLEVPSAAGAR